MSNSADHIPNNNNNYYLNTVKIKAYTAYGTVCI